MSRRSGGARRPLPPGRRARQKQEPPGQHHLTGGEEDDIPASPDPETAQRPERPHANGSTDRSTSDTRFPRSARAAAGALAAFLALGAAGIIGTVLSESVTRPSGWTARKGAAGSTALRVDVLFEQAGWSPPRLPAETPRSSASRTRPADSPADPPPESARESTGVVREFYRLLSSDPARALSLVSASLTDRQRLRIARGWHALSSIRPQEIVPTGNGEVLATVAARDEAGTGIALRHSFSITRGSDPRISRVRLRAARLQRADERG
ncbi:hypothetical protein [Actinopolyspora saharensis]|uniref:Uncharacterized protein n=1 Tax=Actinopolyspora saharensis TaxID=995062 RepID=A0A1H1GQ00_9ACTN|nr:hypothetical protein [Actinopolyspora saharensis]SDR15284.1 hypothetical protein SAMN04489718_3791 [Actinopolyspora saharensis]